MHAFLHTCGVPSVHAGGSSIFKKIKYHIINEVIHERYIYSSYFILF